MEFLLKQMGADTEVPDDGGFTPVLNSGEHVYVVFTC